MLRRMLLVAVLLTPWTAQAQPQPNAQRRAEVRQHIEDFVVQRVTQALALDATQAQRYREVWSRYDQQIWSIHRDNGQTMKAIRAQLAAPQPDAHALDQLSDTILKNKAHLQQLEAQRTDELRHVLTPLQFAKGLTVVQQIQHEVREQMAKALHPGQPPGANDE